MSRVALHCATKSAPPPALRNSFAGVSSTKVGGFLEEEGRGTRNGYEASKAKCSKSQIANR